MVGGLARVHGTHDRLEFVGDLARVMKLGFREGNFWMISPLQPSYRCGIDVPLLRPWRVINRGRFGWYLSMEWHDYQCRLLGTCQCHDISTGFTLICGSPNIMSRK